VAEQPLRELLRCPACAGELSWDADGAACTACSADYVDGLPVAPTDLDSVVIEAG